MRPWLYLCTTVLWTWIWMLPAVLLDQWWLAFPSVFFILIGGLGPMITALLFIHIGFHDPSLDKNISSFLRRCFSCSGLTRKHLLIMIGCLACIILLPILFDGETRSAQGLFTTGPVVFLVVGLVFGALEEIGWRGYAQESCNRHYSPLTASLIIGLFWALWHLPLFYIEGTYQNQLVPGSTAFWVFLFSLPVGSLVYGWLYGITGNAVSAPLLFHGIGNMLRELFTDPKPMYAFAGEAFLAVLVLCISWSWMIRKPSV